MGGRENSWEFLDQPACPRQQPTRNCLKQGRKRGLTPEAVLWLPPCAPRHTLIHRERLKINTSSKTHIHHWAVENYNAIPLHTPIRMAKNTTSGKHSHTLMERMQNDKAFLEMVWQSIIKLNIHLPFESSCGHLEEVTTSAHKQSCKWRLGAALFVTGRHSNIAQQVNGQTSTSTQSRPVTDEKDMH